MTRNETARSKIAVTGAGQPNPPDSGEAGQPGVSQASGEWPYPSPARPAQTQPEPAQADRQQRIAELAYKIAEENGFPEGMELEHWLAAERSLPAS